MRDYIETHVHACRCGHHPATHYRDLAAESEYLREHGPHADPPQRADCLAYGCACRGYEPSPPRAA